MAERAGMAVAVLAAGRGSRFGGNKLDAPCAGRAVGRWVLDAVAEAGLPPGLLVLPPREVTFARTAPDWQQRVNPRAEEGLGTSLALAARWALKERAAALLVLLGDMPLVDPGYLRRLSAAPPPAATVLSSEVAGVPALLSPDLLEQAALLGGDRGAGPLLANAKGLTVLAPPPDMLLDVDRVDDLARASDRLLARRSER